MLGRWCLLAVLTLLAAGCGSTQRNPQTQAQGDPAAAQPLPGVPRDPQLSDAQIVARRPNQLVSTRRAGSDTFRRSALTETAEFERLRIGNHESDTLGWAIYQFPGFTALEPVSGLGLSIMPGAPSRTFWVGYCDFKADRWVLNEATAEFEDEGGFIGTNVVVPFETAHTPVSPSGNVYVAVLSYGNVVTVNTVDVVYEDVLPPPVGLGASDGTEVGGIRLSWEDPAVTYDPDGVGTFNYDAIGIERSLNGIDGWFELPDQAPGVTEYVDGTDSETPPQPGVTYHYRVRTLKGTSKGRPSDAVMGRIGIRPQARFTLNPASSSTPALVTFDASNSQAGSSPIVEYRWRIGTDYVNAIRDVPVHQQLMNFDTTLGVWLTVVDAQGLASAEAFKPLNAIHLVDDNPLVNDPHEFGMINGSPGAYTVQLGFEIDGGTPNWRVEFDSNYTGVFAPEPGIPTVTIKDFPTAPNVQGPYNLVVNIPAAQPSGQYYFAIRVTDQSTPPNVSVYVWPQPVNL